MPVLRSMAVVPWQRLIPPTPEMGNLKDMEARWSTLLAVHSPDSFSTIALTHTDVRPSLNKVMSETTLFSLLLQEIPPEWHPRSRQDWYALSSLTQWTSLINLEGALAMATSIIRAHKGGWSAVAAEVAALVSPYQCNDALSWLWRGLNDVMGMKRGVVRVRVIRKDEVMYTNILSLLFGRNSWRAHEMADISSHWHGAATLLAAEMRRICLIGYEDEFIPEKPDHKEWAALSECDVHSLAGGQATWLTSKTMLQAETDKMGHCVWSYDSLCMDYYAHIASITGEDGSVSTLQFSIACHMGDRKRFSVEPVQHWSKGNDDPSQSCLAVAEELLALCSKIPQERLAMLVRACDRRCSQSKDWLRSHAGRSRDIVDINSVPQREAMLLLMERFLHRKWRGMALDDFCAAVQPHLPEVINR